jgi:flavin reductase (DIM6/NTAB) family NADH-FMN oxidoreductase RutF
MLELGSHDMFIAEVTAVRVDEKFMDEKGAFHMDDVKLIAYEHGTYRKLGDKLGKFGFSVKKK